MNETVVNTLCAIHGASLEALVVFAGVCFTYLGLLMAYAAIEYAVMGPK